MSLITVIWLEKEHKQVLLRDLPSLGRFILISLTETYDPHVMSEVRLPVKSRRDTCK